MIADIFSNCFYINLDVLLTIKIEPYNNANSITINVLLVFNH